MHMYQWRKYIRCLIVCDKNLKMELKSHYRNFDVACPKYVAKAIDTSTVDDLPNHKINFEIVKCFHICCNDIILNW